MKRRSPTSADLIVWSVSALLLLAGLVASPAWSALDPLLQAELALDEGPRDPWGTEFRFELDDARSAGPDRRFETADDLVFSAELDRARFARLLPALGVLGVLLLAAWELGFLVVALMRGPRRPYVDEGLLLGGWALVGGLLVYGAAEFLVRRELLDLPDTAWLAVPPSIAVAGAGAAAGAVVGLLIRLQLLQVAVPEEGPPDPPAG